MAGVELAIDTTVKRSTGMSPFMLSHGREARITFSHASGATSTQRSERFGVAVCC